MRWEVHDEIKAFLLTHSRMTVCTTSLYVTLTMWSELMIVVSGWFSIDHIDWTLHLHSHTHRWRAVLSRKADYWQKMNSSSLHFRYPYHLFLISVDNYHDRFQWEILILFQLSSAMLCHSCFSQIKLSNRKKSWNS